MTKEQQEKIIEAIEADQLESALAAVSELEEGEAGSAELTTAQRTDLLILKATIYLRQEEYMAAVSILNDVVEEEPGNPVALLMLGTALAQIDQDEDARRVFRVVSRLADDPWAAEARSALAALGDDQDLRKTRLSIVCSAGLDSFALPMLPILEQQYELRLYTVASTRDVAEALEWGDVCWFEWCDDSLVKASQRLEKQAAVICRIHSDEVFTDMPRSVNWEFVDEIVFVAEHVREIFDASVNGETARHRVIHNGVQTSRYSFRDRAPGFNVGYLGHVNFKKNMPLALQIIKALVTRDDRYQLHVAGAFQDLRDRIYFDHMVSKLDLAGNVIYTGWSDDVNSWLEDKDYILSTSVFEPFGMSIAEAMAKGIKPVIHNWPGADGVYPEEVLFSTIDEAVEMIVAEKYQSALYRAFIQDHYELSKCVDEFSLVVDQLARRAAPGVQLAA